jgi:hypothetical protein
MLRRAKFKDIRIRVRHLGRYSVAPAFILHFSALTSPFPPTLLPLLPNLPHDISEASPKIQSEVLAS